MIQRNNQILIVDDEEFLCEAMQTHLERRGYLVFVANSAKEAVAIIKEANPNLILLDKIMPELNGIEALRLIRGFNSYIKVIMLSAEELDNQTKDQLHRLNLFAYIRKSTNTVELDSILDKALKSEGINEEENN